VSPRDYMTIGELVENLLPRHPDLSISKVRFLEDEGLINPERTAGGYRKFSSGEAARVDLILRLQREQFLPLAVIREKLKEVDKGRVPEDLRPMVTHPEAISVSTEETQPVPLENVQSALGFPVSFVRELADFGFVRLVRGEAGEQLGPDDVPIAHDCWDLRRFGIEPRHLKMFANFADREAALLAQILMPATRQRTTDSRQKLAESLEELMSLTDGLTRGLVRRAVSDAFEEAP
jgi:DNA-binding transcriptional MerR regulator